MTKTTVAVIVAALSLFLARVPAQAQAGPTLQIIAGDTQNVPLDTATQNAYFAPAVFVLNDANGKPIAGATITVSCNVSSPLVCRMDPSGKSSLSVATDASGYAVVATSFRGKYASVVAFGGLGPVAITAKYQQSVVNTTFTIGSPYVVTITGGNGQAGTYNAGFQPQVPQFWYFTNPLSVLVTDRKGNPVDGGAVTFTCTPPSSAKPRLPNTTIPSCVLTVDEHGAAFTSSSQPLSKGQAQSWLVPPTQNNQGIGFGTCRYPGTYTITATYQGASATFTESAAVPQTQTTRRPLRDTSVCVEFSTSRARH